MGELLSHTFFVSRTHQHNHTHTKPQTTTKSHEDRNHARLRFTYILYVHITDYLETDRIEANVSAMRAFQKLRTAGAEESRGRGR